VEHLAGVPMMGAGLLGGVLLGIGAALLLVAWLGRRPYRYDDEAELPVRDARWLVVVLPVVLGLIGAGWWASAPGTALLLAGYSLVLGALAAIDLDVHRLPDAITLPLMGVTLAGVAAVGLSQGSAEALLRAVAAGAALGGFYLVQVLIGGARGMGLGDAKLAVSLGMVLGLLSWVHVFAGTLAAYLFALMWGVCLIVARKADRRTEIAFGPHMALGAVLVFAAPGVTGLMGLL
jgi:leader peptidase (prepilin peptidase)/N-methyltransferase